LPLLDRQNEAVRDLPALLDGTPDSLRAWLQERGEPALRTRQVRRWILAGGAESFEEMTDLPKRLRQELADAFTPLSARVARHLESADRTHKLLLEMRDRRLVECVLIQEDGRRTACISTQVGCGMGCVFCASGIGGVERNLTSGEILEQLIRLRNLSPDLQRLTHIVVMGMGEPLANLDALLDALEVATAAEGLGIGARHISAQAQGLGHRRCLRAVASAGTRDVGFVRESAAVRNRL
jgi:23S rRNA (adenine2503-C2)-methyltransferase